MRTSLVIFFVAICSFFAKSQNYIWDLGFNIGPSYYLGDIGGTAEKARPGIQDLQLQAARFSIGGFARVRASYRFGINMKLNYLMIYGADKLSPSTSRTTRNLSFRNHIFEASTRLEFYPVIINDLGGTKRYAADLFFSVFGGFGLINHNPQAQLNGKWYNLKGLKTEGINNSYPIVEPVIPFGFGFFTTFKGRKSRIRRNRFGVELNYRLTFTDYLDDVSTVYPNSSELSGVAKDLYYRGWELTGETDPDERKYPEEGVQRGGATSNDSYFTLTFTYSYIIASGKRKFHRPRYGYMYGNNRKNTRKAKF